MVDSVKNNVVVDLKLFCPKKDASPKLVVELSKKGKTLKWLGINLFEEYTEIDRWQSYHYDLNLRQYLHGADLIKVFILNEEGSPCFVDDFNVAFK
jgi:hypothetical protein